MIFGAMLDARPVTCSTSACLQGELATKRGQTFTTLGADKNPWRLAPVNFKHVFHLQWFAVVFKSVELVEDENLRNICGTDLGQNALNLRDLLRVPGV